MSRMTARAICSVHVVSASPFSSVEVAVIASAVQHIGKCDSRRNEPCRLTNIHHCLVVRAKLALIAPDPKQIIAVQGPSVLPGQRAQRIFKKNMSPMFSTLSYYFLSKCPARQGLGLLFSSYVGSLHPALAREANDGEVMILLFQFTKIPLLAQSLQEGHVPTECPSLAPALKPMLSFSFVQCVVPE